MVYDYIDGGWPVRTLCSVLEDMRKLHETRNYSSMLSLIEEAQFLANRMEAALDSVGDLKRMTEEKSKLKKEIRKLRKERDKQKE